jgi:predicted unusual protein kinase regulating ubiquinone biosynthesis (AarF/ABC1/UbiB family)
VLRTLRALLLFWSVFASYGWQWLLTRILGRQRTRERLKRVNQRNARRLAVGFMRLRGVFIKLGQVLSVIGTFLPRAYGEALERLQDKVPPQPFSEVEGRLREALGERALELFQSFEREPMAAASLAQVHRAVTKDGRIVAVKVRYPGIETLIRRDLRVLRWILPLAERLITVSHLERVLDQVSAMLAREIDYTHERENIERIRRIFAGQSNIVIPQVIDELTNAGVLTMSCEDGTKITDFGVLRDQGIETEPVARLLVESYFTMLLQHRVFHADPHPGNFLVRRGPVLVILDFGAVEEVTDALAEGMKTVVLGSLARDDDQILRGIERMGFVAEGGDRALLGKVGREYLKVLSSMKIEDYSRIDRRAVEKLAGYTYARGRLREIMRSVQYPDGFFYVERTLLLLFGLVGQLAPRSGLPGLLLPHASRVFAMALSGTPAQQNGQTQASP